MKQLLAAILALALFAPLAAEPNPLDGHEVAAIQPAPILVLTDDTAGVTWAGPVVLTIDGRPAVTVTLEPVSVPLPRRRWGAGDYLVGAGIAVGGAAVGYVAGRVVQALR